MRQKCPWASFSARKCARFKARKERIIKLSGKTATSKRHKLKVFLAVAGISLLAASAIIAIVISVASLSKGKTVIFLDDIKGFRENYYIGDELEAEGTIRATYDDGRVEIVPITEDMVEGFDSSERGESDVTITYKDATAIVPLTISPLKVRSLSVDESTVSDVVYKGVPFPSGLYVIAEMMDDSTRRVPVTSYMVRGFDGTALGRQKVTITYMNADLTMTVEVVEDEIAQIAVQTEKYAYSVGEPIALGDMLLLITNKSGMSRTVRLTESMLEGVFDSSTPGERELTVRYSTFTTVYHYTVS